MAFEELNANGMMKHLLDALNDGEDIGHYGRHTFAMVARHFIEPAEVVRLLAKDRDFSERQARALVQQIVDRDYGPPKPDRILHWQLEQDFPICPGRSDEGCHPYRDLTFPNGVYKIEQCHAVEAEA